MPSIVDGEAMCVSVCGLLPSEKCFIARESENKHGQIAVSRMRKERIVGHVPRTLSHLKERVGSKISPRLILVLCLKSVLHATRVVQTITQRKNYRRATCIWW